MRRSFLALCLFLAAGLAHAQFAAFVLPARFELKAKPGEKLAEVLEIGNDDTNPGDYRFRTADWTMKADGGVDFRPDALDPGSCRPWVRLERLNLRIASKAKRRYRFEVHVPADAPEGLCRFAILIEPGGDVAPVAPSSGIQMPIVGRLGIIVYIRIGDSKPKLTLERLAVQPVNGRDTAVAIFRNEGNAHGRPEGTLAGTDASGRPFDFTVAPLPILPGETRAIPIWAQDSPDGRPGGATFPVKLKGVVEWEGGRQPVDATVGK
ncbi:MAG: hypothetical protein IPL06_15430 [Betaproteobacteria bacterium]|nr:hypothetical protein [Betaproteobacteria bacterium]